MLHLTSNNSLELASHLIKIKAVIFSPGAAFTYSSGLKSPIYCDLRQLMAYPQLRCRFIGSFISLIEKINLEFDVIVGTATAGIPHAAFLAHQLNLPMAYVRGSAKKYGRGKQIEGCLNPGQRVLLIEDLISTGGSIIQAADALIAEGAQVVHGMSIFNYQLPAAKIKFEKLNWPLVSLVNLDTLLGVAHTSGYINSEDIHIIHAWRQDPYQWSSNIGNN